jgi:hypothetical protein
LLYFLPICSLRHLVMSLVLVGPALAQATVGVPCAVRIRPRAASDYDPSREVILRGRVVGREQGLILLRLSAGIVRVDAGAWVGPGSSDANSAVEILASGRQENGRQWFLAREISHAGGRVMIRDARGVPALGASRL